MAQRPQGMETSESVAVAVPVVETITGSEDVDAVADVEEEGGEEREIARDAIVYVPGIDHGTPPKEIAARVRSALDINAATGSARFEYEAGASLKYGSQDPTEQFESTRYTVTRRDGGPDAPDVPVVDIYRLDYQDNLTRKWNRRNVFVQTLLLALTIVMYALIAIPVAVKTLWALLPFTRRKEAVRLRDVLQLSIVMLLFAVFVVYLVLLVVAVVEAVQAVGDSSPQLTDAQGWVILATALGFASPRSLKEAFVSTAVNYLTLAQYLAFGARRRGVWGQLNSLIEGVQEYGEYERIHLVGFSFGSVIAIDALYPPGEDPPPRYDAVHELVTIGCPVDLIRAYRPRYFSAERMERSGVPAHWTNIYIPSDVLGSNFRNDSALDVAEFSVMGAPAGGEPGTGGRPENRVHLLAAGTGSSGVHGAISWIFLAGLNAHVQYWGDRPSDADAFREVVTALYDGQPALA